MAAAATATGRPAVIRKLGHLDVYHSAWHTLRHLIAVVIACRYAVPSSPGLSEQQLRTVFEHAVARTVLDHPVLRVGIIDDTSKKPIWARIPSVDLAAHMDWQTLDCTSEQDYETKLQALIDHHHDTQFTELATKPGWRMTLLRRRISSPGNLSAVDGTAAPASGLEPFVEVVFSWNHANFDGMGGKIFHETLLGNLNKVASAAKDDIQLPLEGHVLDLAAYPLNKKNFTPNLHDVTKLPVTPGFTVKTAWKELKPAKKTAADPAVSTNSHGTLWAPCVEEPYKTHTLRSHPLDGPALSRVLALCRKQAGGGVTLTALLHALCLSSMAPLFPAGTATTGTVPPPDYFEAGTALNFRRFLKPSPPGYPGFEPSRTMANYVTSLDHKFGPDIVAEIRKTDASDDPSGVQLTDATKAVVWRAAAQIKRDLQARMDLGVKNDQAGLMALVGDWRAQHSASAKKPRHFAWALSNIGVINGGDGTSGNNWTIDKSWFTVGAMVTGGVFMVSPVAVKGQGLFLACTWQDGVVEKQFAEKFFARLDARLRELAVE
ncbi:uncharacterized protein B0I36DRAFT_427254 [Microdochium trichocladiopsis]|uniref:Alcohol acetyltransferase n=1 Tax=Microdochium trichocladiopsis TaxID=1682393 RepID=A0A9P8YIK4_9PEZI|nr:uncharacterized protein B0I36DRAFT_427254 [Microdochium trichocladiopsis]KAH7040940.1 hypothetical protein B0I36DRAFT_427254 [Microdochium trichocladiopsis]